jgi:hypothetical protein
MQDKESRIAEIEALTIARFEPGVYEVVRAFAPGEPN